MEAFNLWMGIWEPTWLFLILLLELVAGVYTAWMVTREYNYDKEKDDLKKQRRTRTTKKTTTQNGATIIDETTEVTEPVQEEKK